MNNFNEWKSIVFNSNEFSSILHIYHFIFPFHSKYLNLLNFSSNVSFQLVNKFDSLLLKTLFSTQDWVSVCFIFFPCKLPYNYQRRRRLKYRLNDQRRCAWSLEDLALIFLLISNIILIVLIFLKTCILFFSHLNFHEAFYTWKIFLNHNFLSFFFDFGLTFLLLFLNLIFVLFF